MSQKPRAEHTFALTLKGDSVISGFSAGAGDVLDLRTVLSEAHLSLGGDMTQLGTYLHVSNQGGSASLMFDPTGTWQTPGSQIALLQNVGSAVSSLADLTSHNAIRIS